MKISIKSAPSVIPSKVYWVLKFNGNETYYESQEAACIAGAKAFKRYQKECSAYSMLEKVSTNLLTLREYEFVSKLIKTKCKGISKPQYGYLKGIFERQEREW